MTSLRRIVPPITPIQPVLVETPYSASTSQGIAANVEYAWKALAHAYSTGGYAPVATHLLWTRLSKEGTKEHVPDEAIHKQIWGREHALSCAAALRRGMKTLFYCDHGFSSGMAQALKECIDQRLECEFIFLDAAHQGHRWADIEMLFKCLQTGVSVDTSMALYKDDVEVKQE